MPNASTLATQSITLDQIVDDCVQLKRHFFFALLYEDYFYVKKMIYQTQELF